MINYRYIPTVFKKRCESKQRVLTHKLRYKEHCLKSLQPSNIDLEEYKQPIHNINFYDKNLQNRCPIMLERFNKDYLTIKRAYLVNKLVQRRYNTWNNTRQKKMKMVHISFNVGTSFYLEDQYSNETQQYVVQKTIKFGYKRCSVYKEFYNGKFSSSSYTYPLFNNLFLEVKVSDNIKQYFIKKQNNIRIGIDITEWLETNGITEKELFTNDQYLAMLKLTHV